MNTIKGLFVTGIGTGVGKTVVSAVLAQHFQADYWKPVQSGDLLRSDSMMVGEWIDSHLHIHPERFRFGLPASPHQAAAVENRAIRLSDFGLPDTRQPLIVEGAGGLLVPLNDEHFMIDLIACLGLSVVLVVRDYLGCINHTLLSVGALVSRNIPITYMVLNGPFNPATKAILEKHAPAETMVIAVPEMPSLSRESIRRVALEINTKESPGLRSER